jgi:hypothetical protein
VTGAPALVAAVWLITTAVSLPLTIAMRASLQGQLDASLEAEAASDADYDWMQEFRSQANDASPLGPLAITMGPRVIGFAAVLDNVSAFADLKPPPALVVVAGAGYVLLWTFLAGGIIDRLARDRATHAHGFFTASGVFFFRFLRLGVVAWAGYALLFAFVHSLLFDDWYPAWTANVTTERTAFLIRLALYAAFAALLAAWNVIVDYAKIRAVVEDRRSALGALLAAMRFVNRNPRAVAAQYAACGGVFVAVLAAYALVGPGARSTGVLMWVGFAVSQAYIVARLWVKLLFWASETALFQSRLAHAGYVARPLPRWPESPSAEAIIS